MKLLKDFVGAQCKLSKTNVRFYNQVFSEFNIINNFAVIHAHH